LSYLYNNKKPLKQTDNLRIKKGIGVLVCSYLPNHQGLGGIPAVDIEVEQPVITTITNGGYIPLDSVSEKLNEFHENTLRQIEIVIQELEQHRDYIKIQLSNIDNVVDDCKKAIADYLDE